MIKNSELQNKAVNNTVSFGQESNLHDANSREDVSADSKQKSVSGHNESNTQFACSMNLDEEDEVEENDDDDSQDFLTYYIKMSSSIDKLQEQENYNQAIQAMYDLLKEINRQEFQSQFGDNSGDYNQEDYRDHIDFKELKVRIGNKLGAQLYARGLYQETVEELDRVLSTDLGNLQALYKIHEAHTKLNNRKEARLILKRIKESMHTSPTSPVSQQKIDNNSLMLNKKGSITPIMEVDESVDISDS